MANSDYITDRKAIQDFWQGAMDMGIKKAKLEHSEVEKDSETRDSAGSPP